MAPIDHTDDLPLSERKAIEQHLARFNQAMKTLLTAFNIQEYALGLNVPLPVGATIEGKTAEGATIELITVHGEHLDSFLPMTMELTRSIRDGVDEMARKTDRRDALLSVVDAGFGKKPVPGQPPQQAGIPTFWNTAKGES